MNKKILDKIQIEEVIALLEKGYTRSEIAPMYNMTTDTLNENFKRNGLNPKHFRCKIKKGKRIKNYTFVDKHWLIDNWINTGYSMADLSKLHNIPIGVIGSRAGRYGLTKKYKHPLNISKINDMNDVHIWYLAGLVATDGHIAKNHNLLDIGLVGNDEKTLLQSILDYYEIKDAIRCYKNGYAHSLQFCFDNLQEFFLKNFNIPSGNKTFVVGVPEYFPNENCAKAYVLGCIDGDGTVQYTKKKGLRFGLYCASNNFVDGLIQLINRYLPQIQVKKSFHKNKRDVGNDYPGLALQGENAFKFLQWAYSLGNSCFRLERKYNKFCQKRDELMR